LTIGCPFNLKHDPLNDIKQRQLIDNWFGRLFIKFSSNDEEASTRRRELLVFVEKVGIEVHVRCLNILFHFK
jgi:hypothetical protein